MYEFLDVDYIFLFAALEQVAASRIVRRDQLSLVSGCSSDPKKFHIAFGESSGM
jgi:hypothetical protein